MKSCEGMDIYGISGAILVLMALAAPVLAPNDPDAANLAMKNGAPCPEYPLGCDQMGRCELSRLLYARYSLGLSIPILAVLAAFALFAGSFSCYQGGMIDEMVRLICDIWMAFPLLVIAMTLAASFENPAACMIAAISISMTAWFLRMVRSFAKTECGKEYIEAARISGASGIRIVVMHLVPNVLPQFLVYFTTGIASVIISISGFSFLGVGLVKGTAEWGAMLNEARNSLFLFRFCTVRWFHLWGDPEQEKQRSAGRLLGLDDTERIWGNYPFELSGGMLQRLMIAAAIIQEPELLGADEAATAIDACNRLELMGQMKQFCGLGMSVLLVTHDLKAASVSDRIMIMNHGKIVETGQTDLVMNCPKDECTKELVNASYLRRGADDRTK